MDDHKKTHAAYMRMWRQQQRGLEPIGDNDTPISGGPVEQAVAAELATYPATESRPGLAEGCLAMARILDSTKLSTTHPSALRQLLLSLDAIKNSSHVARGKLAAVAELANKPSANNDQAG